jgi:hypothetical protein
MGDCKDKIKIRCKKVDANCVNYETNLPNFSELNDCVTIAETTQELYDLVGGIKTEINLTDLESCVTLPTNPTVKNTMQTLIDFICLQQTKINALQSAVTSLQSYTGENNCGSSVSNSFGNNILNVTARTVVGNTTFNTPSNKADGIYTLATLEDLPKVSNNFANDTAAAIGGIAVGRLYHTAGIVKIRIS